MHGHSFVCGLLAAALATCARPGRRWVGWGPGAGAKNMLGQVLPGGCVARLLHMACRKMLGPRLGVGAYLTPASLALLPPGRAGVRGGHRGGLPGRQQRRAHPPHGDGQQVGSFPCVFLKITAMKSSMQLRNGGCRRVCWAWASACRTLHGGATANCCVLGCCWSLHGWYTSSTPLSQATRCEAFDMAPKTRKCIPLCRPSISPSPTTYEQMSHHAVVPPIPMHCRGPGRIQDGPWYNKRWNE